MQSADTTLTDDRVPLAIDDFGFDLLRHTLSSSGPNTVVSPYSVSAALAMLGVGARSQTASQMREVLHASAMNPSDVGQRWRALNASLGNRSSQQTLEVANAAWVSRTLTVRPAFASDVNSIFGARLQPVDFASQDMAPVINAWVSQRTHQMIPKIVDSVAPTTVLALADAVYFKGAWQTPFRVGGTEDGVFSLQDGSKAKVPMMSRWDESIQSLETSSFVMVRLPYKGADSAMYLLLPNSGSELGPLVTRMHAAQFISAVRESRKAPTGENTILGVPRLDLAWGQDNLKDTLSSMGMPAAFNPSAADFTGISTQGPLWIDKVAHKTRIKVGELGTEAAAATYEGLAGGYPKPIIFDRPFLFAVIDEKSDTMLFLGAVGDPRKQ